MAAIGLLYVDGFDWPILATGPAVVGGGPFTATQIPWAIGAASVQATLVPGRYTGISGTHAWLANAQTALTDIGLGLDLRTPIMGSTYSATSGVGDSQTFYCGFNMFIGYSGTVVPAVTSAIYHRCFYLGTTAGFVTATAAGAEHVLSCMVQWTGPGGTGAATIQLVKGAPLTTLSGGTPTVLATGSCNQNPWFRWAYVEMGIYRSATSGLFDIWIEGTGGTLQNVIHYAGDTSVATLGQISKVWLSSSKVGGAATGGAVWNAFDDFWCATSGRPGEIVTVLPIRPASDVTTQFTTTCGSTHWNLVNISPTTSDSYLIGVKGTTGSAYPQTDEWGQATWPYTPTNVWGIQSRILCYAGGTTGAALPSAFTFIKATGTSYNSAVGTSIQNPSASPLLTVNLLKLLELNPATSGAWTPTTAQQATFGVTTSGGASGGSNLFVYAGFMDVLATMPTTASAPPTIGLMWMDGFDEWYAISPMIATAAYFVKWQQTSFSVLASGHESSVLFSGGRQGRGRSLGMSLNATLQTPNSYTATVTGTTVSDGFHIYAGFNAYLGCTNSSLVPNTGDPTGTGGYCRVFGFSNGQPGSTTGALTQTKVSFYYDVGANSFVATKGTGTPPGGTGTPLTVLASGQPTRNPWQHWTYFEIHCYRSANSGAIDLWIENSGGTMDHLLSVVTDTSVALLGNLGQTFLECGEFNGAIWFPVEYDDFWIGGNGSPGVPSYVVTVGALSGAEASTSGPNVWTGSSGNPMGSVCSELPWDTTDYAIWGPTITGGNGNQSQILFNQQTYPFGQPQTIFALQALCGAGKLQTVSGATAAASILGQAVIRRDGIDYPGTSVAFTSSVITGANPIGSTGFATLILLGSLLEQDPATGTRWTLSNANNNTTMGVATSGQTTATGVGAPSCVCFAASMMYLASIATVASGAPGSPASGFGQPFWLVCSAPWFPNR